MRLYKKKNKNSGGTLSPPLINLSTANILAGKNKKKNEEMLTKTRRKNGKKTEILIEIGVSTTRDRFTLVVIDNIVMGALNVYFRIMYCKINIIISNVSYIYVLNLNLKFYVVFNQIPRVWNKFYNYIFFLRFFRFFFFFFHKINVVYCVDLMCASAVSPNRVLGTQTGTWIFPQRYIVVDSKKILWIVKKKKKFNELKKQNNSKNNNNKKIIILSDRYWLHSW